jgi:class 3 adenylate cyclase
VEVPRRIRFGLARGTVYKLMGQRQEKNEYIGFCINLASRLQRYCPELGFIASARLGLPKATLDKHRYRRVIATKLRGFPKEVVIVDKMEYQQLDQAVKDRLFEEI